ncbi:MAG: hypothetical protein LBS84_12240 [Clostridiales bacterium]|jgi:vacuolar-type H+-ATPase subunit H|nr:hypothetical protein [Clostridiales bacterium]
MSLDAFEKVQSAESRALEIINAAKREAAAIIAEAEREAVRITGEAERVSRETAAKRLDEAGRESQSLLEASLADLSEEKEAVINRAKTREQAAVDRILEAIAG